MATTRARRIDPGLWERAKDEVTKGDRGGRAGPWSARKAQLAVQDYKRRGGGYEGQKRADRARAYQFSRQPKRIAQKTARYRSRGGDRSDPPSKAELYEQARRRGIPGRSKMGRDELQRALDRRASGASP
jgi:hypothetical protein